MGSIYEKLKAIKVYFKINLQWDRFRTFSKQIWTSKLDENSVRVKQKWGFACLSKSETSELSYK